MLKVRSSDEPMSSYTTHLTDKADQEWYAVCRQVIILSHSQLWWVNCKYTISSPLPSSICGHPASLIILCNLLPHECGSASEWSSPLSGTPRLCRINCRPPNTYWHRLQPGHSLPWSLSSLSDHLQVHTFCEPGTALNPRNTRIIIFRYLR